MRPVYALVLTIGCGIVACACSHRSVGPLGWVQENATTWVMGSGDFQQRYIISETAFSGSLSDLMSQVTKTVVLRHAGSRLVHSYPLWACPWEGRLAYFRTRNVFTTAAFAANHGRARTVLYERPIGLFERPEPQLAWNAWLCKPPG